MSAATKKAAPLGAALLSPHTLSPSAEPMPVSEGIPLNWHPYFYGLHNRNPEGSDGGTESQDFYSNVDTFFKAIPPGARWITVRPNGPSAGDREPDGR